MPHPRTFVLALLAGAFELLAATMAVNYTLDPQYVFGTPLMRVDDNANLRCPVKLSLRDLQGRPVTRRVTYMVGTDPQITVFREIAL